MPTKNTILLVDDDPVTRKLIIRLLQDEGQLKTLDSGEECVEKAPEMKPDIILLDVFMPGIDGYETCKRLRKIPALAHTKIIMISVKSKPENKLHGYQSGADDYIAKPLRNDELKAKIRINLKLKALGLENDQKIDLLSDLAKQIQSLYENIRDFDRAVRENSSLCKQEGNNIKNLTQAGEKLAKLTEDQRSLSMKQRVLIVDDDEQNRAILLEILENKYDIAEACCGEEALSMYAEFKPDLILLDIMMPGVDGREVLRTIRETEEKNRIYAGLGVPIIMLTAHQDPWFKSFGEGCDDYIVKPFAAKQLLEKVESVFKQSKYKNRHDNT